MNIQHQLWRAVKVGKSDWVQKLCKKGANVNERNKGWTPLMLAAANNNFLTAKVLLDYGADPLIKNANDMTALDLCESMVNKQVKSPLSLMLEQAMTAKKKSDLLICVKNGDIVQFEKLAKKGYDLRIIDDANNNLLMIAARLGFLDIVKILVHVYLDDLNAVNSCGRSAAAEAAYAGKLDCLKYLWCCRANLNGIEFNLVKDQYTLDWLKLRLAERNLFNALKTGNMDNAKHHQATIDKLISEAEHTEWPWKNLKNDAESNMPDADVFQAVKDGDLTRLKYIVRCMQERSPDYDPFNIFDGEGYPLVMRACYSDNLEVVKYLVESGADLTAGCKFWPGYNTLHYAKLMKNSVRDYLESLTAQSESELKSKQEPELDFQYLVRDLNDAGQYHNTNDPAIVTRDGHVEWLQNGVRHREDGPAVIRTDGTIEWWQNDMLHREGGLPAVIYSDGTMEYWVNGVEQFTVTDTVNLSGEDEQFIVL